MYEPVIGTTKVLRRLRSAARAARSLASRSFFASAAACLRAACSAAFFAAASSAACCWAAAWASIFSARESPMVMTGVSPVCSTEDSAASAGAARVPITPVVASAATPTAFVVVRCTRLGRRCFPVPQVNAM